MLVSNIGYAWFINYPVVTLFIFLCYLVSLFIQKLILISVLLLL